MLDVCTATEGLAPPPTPTHHVRLGTQQPRGPPPLQGPQLGQTQRLCPRSPQSASLALTKRECSQGRQAFWSRTRGGEAGRQGGRWPASPHVVHGAIAADTAAI